MKTTLTIFLVSLISYTPLFAQQEAEIIEDTSGIVIHNDPRLDLVVAALKPKPAIKGVIRSGRGYRVQIYNGNDRNKAIQIKVDFLRRHPDVPAYMTYIQPQFRIKVGDFKTRAEAAELYREMNQLYGAAMIVPDVIVINTFKDDQ